MLKKFHLFLVTFLVCGFLYPSSVRAQEERPPWWYNLDCRKEVQQFSGIQYCTGKPPNDSIHVIVIQLDSPGVQVEYLIPDGIDKNGKTEECKDVNRSTKLLGGPGCDDPSNRNWYPVMSLEQAVNRARKQPNLAVVINGDYSACTIGRNACKLDKAGNPTYREHGPEGLTVVHGHRLDGPINGDGDNNIVKRPYLVISQSTPLRAEIHSSVSDRVGVKPYDWIYTGMGGAPWLIQDGKALPNLINCEGADTSSCRDNASQTSVGLTLDKNWMFIILAIDAKRLQDVATFMDEKLDVWQAIKFDGGGSSQLYYAGAKDQYVVKGDGRPLTNFLAIYAQPGTGIFSDNPSEPTTPPDNSEPSSGDDLSWLQKIQKGWNDFWNSTDSWWKDWQKRITNALDNLEKWWQSLPQRLEDLLLQQLVDRLNKQINELCGTAGLVPASMVLVVYLRKRRM
jgi:hypothetical protein